MRILLFQSYYNRCIGARTIVLVCLIACLISFRSSSQRATQWHMTPYPSLSTKPDHLASHQAEVLLCNMTLQVMRRGAWQKQQFKPQLRSQKQHWPFSVFNLPTQMKNYMLITSVHPNKRAYSSSIRKQKWQQKHFLNRNGNLHVGQLEGVWFIPLPIPMLHIMKQRKQFAWGVGAIWIISMISDMLFWDLSHSSGSTSNGGGGIFWTSVALLWWQKAC